MENMLSSCCFTGHRVIEHEFETKVNNALIVTIESLYERGCRNFLAGGAQGFDMLAAEAVIGLRTKYPDIKLLLALPCRNQHIRWNVRDRKRYEKILSLADETVFLCETYCTGCMHLRNKYLVDNSQVCVAYCKHSSGGSAYTMNYARENNREIINLAYEI